MEAWTMQLSPNKQGLLSRLLSRKDLVNALDGLLPFPGLWNDLHLGSIHEDFAMYCDEEMICYLRHIRTTWDAVTLGEPDIRETLDIQTVENLHLRAPSASIIDRHYINQQMDRPSNQSRKNIGCLEKWKIFLGFLLIFERHVRLLEAMFLS
jgi:hypothetical protein